MTNKIDTKGKKKEKVVEKHAELISKLESLGFSGNESKIYIYLLLRGESVLGSKIALMTGIHRQYTYVTLHKLINLGLVVKIQIGVHGKYKANPPSSIEKIARKKLDVAGQVAAELSKISTLDHEQEFEIIVGEKGIREYQMEFVRKAEKGETQYIIGGSAREFIAVMEDDYVEMLKIQEQKEFETYYLGKKTEGPNVSAYGTSKVKFHAMLLEKMPEKLPQFTVRRNTVELYSFFNPPMLYVIKSKEVAEKFKDFFMMLWEMAQVEK